MMVVELKAPSSEVNARFWGAKARDWADIQESTVEPVYEVVLERTRVGRGVRYLDVGCGAGRAVQMAAARGASVSGVDATEPLLAIARERTPEGDFHIADLEALPFEDAAFDVTTGFNAFQYAANPAVALAEAGRVTRSGGFIVVMTWGEPEGMAAASLVAALRPLLPAPPPGVPGPFALSNETALRAFAAEAGLTPVDVFDVASPWSYPDEEAAVRGLNASGVAVRAAKHSGWAAVVDAHKQALAPFRRADGGFSIGASFRCLLARP